MRILKNFTRPTRAVTFLAASIFMVTAASNALARGGGNGGGDRQHQGDHQFSRSDRQNGGSHRHDSVNARGSMGKKAVSSRDQGNRARVGYGDSPRDRTEKIAEREARHKEKIAAGEAQRKEKEAPRKDAVKTDQDTASAHAPMNPAPVGDRSAPVVTSPANTTHPAPMPTPTSGTGSPVVTPPKNTIHPIPGSPAPIVRDHRHEAGATPTGEGGATVSSKSGTVQVDEKNSITVKDVAAVAAKTELKNLSGLGAGIAAPFVFNGVAAYGLAKGGVKEAYGNVKSAAKAIYDYFSW